MLNLTLTTDKLQIITSAAVALDVHASWADLNSGTVTPGRTNTAIATAATTDVVAAPAGSTVRNVKTIHARNKDAALSCDVTVQFNQNATLFELFKVTVPAGASLEYVEGVGFFLVQNTSKLDAKLRVTGDVTFATAATFADVTGLTQAVESGKHYNFEAHLYHIQNASTTGAQFGINGPTMTAMRIQELDVFSGSVSAAAMAATVADVTARDTAAIVEINSAGTPQVALAILSGWINPSAAGTFAVRATSEVTVASGMIVKQGSWCRIWEP